MQVTAIEQANRRLRLQLRTDARIRMCIRRAVLSATAASSSSATITTATTALTAHTFGESLKAHTLARHLATAAPSPLCIVVSASMDSHLARSTLTASFRILLALSALLGSMLKMKWSLTRSNLTLSDLLYQCNTHSSVSSITFTHTVRAAWSRDFDANLHCS
jgi:hypothetical protein